MSALVGFAFQVELAGGQKPACALQASSAVLRWLAAGRAAAQARRSGGGAMLRLGQALPGMALLRDQCRGLLGVQ